MSGAVQKVRECMIHDIENSKRFRIVALFFVCATLASGRLPAENAAEPPQEPAPASKIATDAKSLAHGRKMYETHCMACHGKDGKGNGDAAIALLERPSDLSDITEESDNSLFSVITRGRRPMPRFGKILSEEQRWRIIRYIRTFAH